MRGELQQLLEARVKQCVSQQRSKQDCPKIDRKKASMAKREAEIVKAKAKGLITHVNEHEGMKDVTYSVHFQYLIRQHDLLYIEEEVEMRKATFMQNEIMEEFELEPPIKATNLDSHRVSHPNDKHVNPEYLRAYTYDRLKAVQYAERWWNSYNPAYIKIENNDCTNFISQCLNQGGAPMRGYPNRTRGWWIRGQNYSWSWTVAHALKLYLDSSKTGLRAKRVTSPEQLLLGDVICYDFEGDGRFNHNTIVTGKDANGMPLVNAHTYNSRQRYWAYEDSSAYTPNIKYAFFSIVDG
ncbi:amidase domain-containing protein [Bacillus marasmi]|uniref:amidase domain-containing protein n=1 Tax=Bacillus marasmi TaxID=1926279 RepID=UPI0011C8688E|nr:amidase domain-containing protein [Bacillus marasmi]